MENVFFSIIIPTYNSERTVADTMDSIVSQTFQDFEILIMDGHSTDKTLQIVQTYIDPRVKIHSSEDEGIYDAMNKGIRLAKGRWIYFLGSDDVLYDHSVFEDAYILCKENHHDVLYGNVVFKSSRKLYDGKFSGFKLLQRNICHQAVFHNIRLFQTKGVYNLKYKTLADYEFNLKWFNDRSIRKEYFNRIIAVYNEMGSSLHVRDAAFRNDWNDLKRKYFSTITLWRFNHRHNPFIRIASKFLANLKRQCIDSFARLMAQIL